MLKNVNTVLRLKNDEILKVPFLAKRILKTTWFDKNLLLV